MNKPNKRIVGLVLGLALVSAYAAPALAADGEVCVSPSFTNNWLVTGGNDTTESVLVTIPAGEVRIPLAESTDAYDGRSQNVQLSEKWEVRFLASDGTVLATSAPTEDLPDGTDSAHWSGSLPAVTVPEGVERIVAVHRDDLPADGSPNSLHVTGLTLCWDEPTPDGPVVTTAPAPSTTVTAPTIIDPVTNETPQPAGPVVTLDTDSAAQDTTTTAPRAAAPSLPLTGAETAGIVGLALFLLTGGLALLVVSRRGRSADRS